MTLLFLTTIKYFISKLYQICLTGIIKPIYFSYSIIAIVIDRLNLMQLFNSFFAKRSLLNLLENSSNRFYIIIGFFVSKPYQICSNKIMKFT